MYDITGQHPAAHETTQVWSVETFSQSWESPSPVGMLYKPWLYWELALPVGQAMCGRPCVVILRINGHGPMMLADTSHTSWCHCQVAGLCNAIWTFPVQRETVDWLRQIGRALALSASPFNDTWLIHPKVSKVGKREQKHVKTIEHHTTRENSSGYFLYFIARWEGFMGRGTHEPW